MDPAHACSIAASDAPLDVITALLGHMDLNQRFTCALVSRDWAKAAASATSIVKHGVQDLTQLQQWLDTHGGQVKTLQLLECPSTLDRLPCAQLQDLVLHGVPRAFIGAQSSYLSLSSRVWSDIAAATKLTSLSLDVVSTTAKEADVVSALAALPDLQQLTLQEVGFFEDGVRLLSDSRLLQRLTRLTGLELGFVAAEVLQHLSSLTKLQHLSVHSPDIWAAAGYPGLQELQALTSLRLKPISVADRPRFPACVSQLTALQQLEVVWATIPDLNGLTALTTLTKLNVARIIPYSTQLQLPALQHLSLTAEPLGGVRLHTSSLAACTQLRCLSLRSISLTGPGSLVASSMLQELDLVACRLSPDHYSAPMSTWKMLLPGPGWLPHLTSLVLEGVLPVPDQAVVERLVECCSGLWVLQLDGVTDEQCSTLAQLTDLRDLHVLLPWDVSEAGLRHLARLEQLTCLRLGSASDLRRVQATNKCGELVEQLSDEVLGGYLGLINKVGAGCLVAEVAVVFQADDSNKPLLGTL